MKKLLLMVLIPVSLSLGQSTAVQPYVHAATGFGFMKYEGGRTSTFEAGLIVKRRVALGLERMHIGEYGEAGTWTLADLRAYPFGLRKYGGLWLAGGIGAASARASESESAQWHTLYRFSGAGSKASIGGDIRARPHVFITPAISVRRSIGSAESSFCSHPYDIYGNFAPTTCDAWKSATYQFQAIDVSIALSVR